MANDSDNQLEKLELLNQNQIKAIKDIVLKSILEILPTILNDITPTIITSAEKIIKDKMKETSPNTKTTSTMRENFGTQSQEHEFECFNQKFLNNKLKARNDYFYKETRSVELAKLYEDCLNEEPPYVPKEFREEEKAHTTNKREVEIYANLSEQKLKAEIEILNVRAKTNKEKIAQIDSTIDEFFIANNDSQEIVKTLKENYKTKTNFDENKVNKKWSKKMHDKKEIIKKDKQARKEATTNPTTAATTPKKNSASAIPKPTPPSRPRKENNLESAVHIPRLQSQIFQSRYNYQMPKNYHSQKLPRPPPLFPLNSSTYHPSPWHRDTFPY